MSYFDTYKTRLNVNSSGLEITNSMVEKTFKDSPSYRLAKINNIDVDIRIINTDKDTVKKIAFMPSYKAKIGDIVNFDEENWLITEFEDNKVPSISKVILCNKNLNYLGLDKVIPCVFENATFYSLGIEEDKLITVPDGKVNITVGLNDKTKKIYEGMRFVFDHKTIYQVTFLNTAKADYDKNMGYLIITMKQESPLLQDDLINNIAYNEDLIVPPTPTGQLILQGADSILLDKQSTYSVAYDNNSAMNLTFDWLMELDYTLANIITCDTVSCTLKANNTTTGVVRLVARCRENNAIRITKDITIKKTLW